MLALDISGDALPIGLRGNVEHRVDACGLGNIAGAIGSQGSRCCSGGVCSKSDVAVICCCRQRKNAGGNDSISNDAVVVAYIQLSASAGRLQRQCSGIADEDSSGSASTSGDVA